MAPAEEPDTGERWNVVWDTRRRAGDETRSTAVEKSETAALDRAKHFMRMGFVVYEISGPSGSMDEAEIKTRLQPERSLS